MERERDFNEEMLSDTGYASEYEIDCIEKFVSEICALNARTKHCVIHNYYTMGGALTICTACMIRIADINNVGMSHVRKHETGSFGKRQVMYELQRAFAQYILVQYVPTLKKKELL